MIYYNLLENVSLVMKEKAIEECPEFCVNGIWDTAFARL